MLFEVRANAKRKAKVLFAQILCGLCIVGIFCFLRLDFMADYFKTDPFAYGLFVSFMAVFILLFVVTCYCGVRPRICVDEQTVTFYPLFRRAKEVAWGDMTARKVEADSSYEQLRSTALGMLGATIPYLIYRKAHGLDEPGAVQTCPRRYAYYQGNKKLICILEREMENAERFDQMVCERLDAINLQKEGEGGFSATEVPAKRGGLAAVVLGLTALCAVGAVLFVVMPKMQSVPVSVEPPAAAEKVLYTCEDITFEIDPAWSEIDGYEGSFVDDATGIVYQLNGVSELFPYGAEEFYTELLTYYEENHDPVIGEPLEQSDTADGKERYLANIRMVQDDTYYQYMTVVIFPWQDLVLTFGAQTVADQAALYEDEIIQAVEEMAQSAVYTGGEHEELTFELESTYFSGTSWIASNDGSQWTFDEDGTFHWYQDGAVTDDNYYAGTYTFYVGRQAKDYLTDALAEFGITEEELLQTINARAEYGLEHFVCLTTTNESFLLNGAEQLSEPTQTHYCGFLLEDGERLSLLNMRTATQYEFTKE